MKYYFEILKLIYAIQSHTLDTTNSTYRLNIDLSLSVLIANLSDN